MPRNDESRLTEARRRRHTGASAGAGALRRRVLDEMTGDWSDEQSIVEVLTGACATDRYATLTPR